MTGMTAGELADAAGGRDPSNLKKLADEMVAEGTLRTTEPPALNGGRGRPAQTAYAFAAGERERLEALTEEEAVLGLLETGCQVVEVDASGQTEVLAEVLSQAEAVRGAVWAGNLDGEQPRVIVVFQGPRAVDDSIDLMGAFRKAELDAKRSIITKLSTPGELVKSQQTHKRRIDRNQARRRAMQAAPQLGD